MTVKTKHLALLLTLAATTLMAGCSHHVYSPPARAPSLRSARNLKKGVTSVQAAAHMQGAVFGPEVAGGSVSVHRGITPEIELGVDVTLLEVLGSSGANLDRGIYSGRVEGRFNPQRNHYVALFSGLGGGYAPAGGGFVSGDLGVTLGFENCYVTPFTSLAALVSVPINARPVDTRVGVSDKPEISQAQTTFGAQYSFGARVPLGGWSSCPQRVAPVTLAVGMGFTYLNDGDKTQGFLGMSGAVEFRF
ncbi:MAG: hypothetical protein JRH20_28650 [Deltaproteobacteria bacterium]|nr:hypothetical protein [Deltaproteobacteria bacterium]